MTCLATIAGRPLSPIRVAVAEGDEA